MSEGSLDSRRFRDALSYYASGITIVSGLVDGVPVGFACQSFFSLSLDPPLVCFAVQKSSTSWPKLRPTAAFSINILSGGQLETSRSFGQSGADRWANVKWSKSGGGYPVLEGTLLGLDCSLYAEHEAGDHRLIVARVHAIIETEERADHVPLVYFKGKYHHVAAI